MKLIVFAGGAGKRFWPISRQSKPKQFIQIFNGKSTFELTIDRLAPVYGLYNIFISTTENYVPNIKKLVPSLPTSNIITEPARRDVGPAVGLALMRLKKLGVKEPVALIWADHYIKNVYAFRKVLQQSEHLIAQNKTKVVLIGAQPKFPAVNLGWIEIEKQQKQNQFGNNDSERNMHKLKDFIYRPQLTKAQELFNKKIGLWNTAYMISTIDYLLSFYKQFYPDLYTKLNQIYQHLETPKEAVAINEIYPQLPKIHFDHIVSYNLNHEETIVLSADMGWSDPGTLYSFKQTFKPGNENYITGNVFTHEVKDSLIINNEQNKLIVNAFSNKLIIVNTQDALLIIPAEKVKNISDIYEQLAKNKRLSKYIK